MNNKISKKFYCNDEFRLENSKLFKLIKKNLPNLYFMYDEVSNLIFSYSDIRNEDNNIAYQVQIKIVNNLLTITFSFSTELNNKSIYYVNVLNTTTEPAYKVSINFENFNDCYFQISYIENVKSEEEAYNKFLNSLNYINKKRIIKWIKPIYEIFNPNAHSIKEMN